MSQSVKISRWDTAEFLKSQEDIDLYLEVAFETGDPKQIATALGNAARAQGMMNVANETGLTRENLYTSLSENGNPTLKTITSVMDTLGYQLAVVPTRKKQKVKA
jgi:probable addiction module antidote protein